MRTMALGLVLLVSGCVGPKERVVPEDYTGPGAAISDTVVYPNEGEMYQLFYVDAVDGDTIQNAMTVTRGASAGRGSAVVAMSRKRAVPVKKMRIRLVGTHYASMPIQEMWNQIRGKFFRVKGEVDFEPKEGKEYVVVGELGKSGSSVWIQEMETKEIVTTKVFEKP
ncbi:MAG: hypothetical protein FJY37_15260 [Betaproteobacteria bacterium]|nr:hypothetical protein [Betaproteobacteria bacterium]